MIAEQLHTTVGRPAAIGRWGLGGAAGAMGRPAAPSRLSRGVRRPAELKGTERMSSSAWTGQNLLFGGNWFGW